MTAAPRKFTEAELQELKDRNPCDRIAAKWVALRRHGKKFIGPCPFHSPNPNAADSTSFECWSDGWVCVRCNDGGDVIKLLQLRENLGFVAAVERLGGVRQLDPQEAQRLDQERARRRELTERTAADFRERERRKVYEIWGNGAPIGGTAVEEYWTLRGIAPPPGMRLRCIADMPYYDSGKKDAEVIHRGPAMLAPIIGNDGKFSGLHITYIDLDRPKGKLALEDPEGAKAREDGRERPYVFDAKKVRGSKKGGHIEVVSRTSPGRLVIGEGIEKVAAVWLALESMERADVATAFWTSVDLGNMGGKSAESVPHPERKNAGGRVARVPGPEPDLESPGIAIPDSVTEVIILGDATSDNFDTRCALARAAVRWAKPGRTIKVAWCWADADFDDVLRLSPHDEACRRIVEAFDAATPVERPAVQAPQPPSESKSRRQARPISSSSTAGPDAASASPSARPAPLSAATEETSQTGVSEADFDISGGGDGRDGEPPEDVDALNRRLAWFPRTDLGNAERFVQRHRGTLMFCEAVGWLWWDGCRWAREGSDQRVKRAEHETVRAIQLEAKALAASGRDILVETKRDGTPVMVSDKLALWGRSSEANSKITSIEGNARAYLSVSVSQLDADPLMINLKNGTLVVRRIWANGAAALAPGWRRISDYIRLKPHDPKDLITKLAPVDFNPSAERAVFDRFIAEVQPEPAMRRFLQQWKGYSTTADSSEHRMAMFIGKGRNGKSVFEDATAHVAGDYAETVPIETFLASGREANANAPSPARALLHNARMVRTSEPNKGAAFDEGFIKLVTGGEPIQARNLNLPLFRFYPVLKLTVSGNHRPKIGGTDEGIWSRITLVLWNVIIPPEKRDRSLTEKLRAEASGILNWMLDGLSDWIEHGLLLPEEVVRSTAEYRRDSDQLGRFLEVCVGLDPDARTQSSVLHVVFNAWARANGAAEWSNKGLTNAMRERGFKSDKSSVMFWLGIKLTKHEGDFGEAPSGRMNAPAGGSGGSSDGRRGGRDDEIAF